MPSLFPAPDVTWSAGAALEVVLDLSAIVLEERQTAELGEPSVEPAGQSVAAAPQNVFESVRCDVAIAHRQAVIRSLAGIWLKWYRPSSTQLLVFSGASALP